MTGRVRSEGDCESERVARRVRGEGVTGRLKDVGVTVSVDGVTE